MGKGIKGFVQDLDGIDATDPEKAHGQADEVLLAAVDPKIREAYERLVERADWWAGA